MQELKTIAKNFINLFYPLHCLGCAKQLDALNKFHLCGQCIGSIKCNAMPPFELETSSVIAYSACLYEGITKDLIHSFKYKGKTALTGIFAKIMINYIRENPEITEVDMITAVPLHKARLKEREFNQSLLLANKIAKEFSMPIKHTLEKTVKTRYQNELSKSDRLVNLKNAFRVYKNTNISGKSILLIDDVMTTGATLNECAGILLSGDAKRVTCLTLARGI
ncbi:MAG: ComF family protein [Candidatus Omnitrophota bacterium]|nr:ComF family protein [Candidatus Omnitrophota bacterium]